MKKGFTLIELMVVIAVIGIMAGITSNSSHLFKRQNDLKASTVRTLNTIKLARSLAIIARKEVCIKPDITNTINWCSTAPSVDATNTRALMIMNKLDALMKETFKLRNGSITSDGDNQIKFNSQGTKNATSSTYFRFTATDDENENVGYYIIQVSISGSTRLCDAAASAIKCN
jgi:prepilin-type N-terminal cleavage/methylation domain-containing protein